MIKPRGKVTRSWAPSKAYAVICEPEFEIAVWTPRPDGQPPYEQVHFIFKLGATSKEGLEVPLVIRFKSPDTLGFFIEELASYRRQVWPDAEPVTLDDRKEET